MKKEHLTWWDKNHGIQNENLKQWLASSDQSSRDIIYKLIIDNSISSVLECGPGTFIDYNQFFSKNKNVKYCAIDITDSIVEFGVKNKINIKLNSIESIGLNDDEVEFVYCRHVLEHQDYYEESLKEMLRVASKIVSVGFWMILDDDEDNINYDSINKLYHNKYSRPKINAFLESLGYSFEWIHTNNDYVLVIKIR
jgi:ubiquinone/menaquinone biosynthesis C-methylase UbiE